MFRDLDVEIWPEHVRPEQHLLMNALLGDGFREPASSIAESDHIDDHYNLRESNSITDADSSQMAAILDAKQGRNMVIQGPPGTGKSQTITNLIAEAVADGKKVLFVSEKMAALEVVKRRLDAVGLGVACLELHSQKTNKKSLLNELAKTLDLGKPVQNHSADLHLLEDLRKRLNEYAAAMNTKVGNSGITPFEAIGKLVREGMGRIDGDLPKITIDSMNKWTGAEFSKRENLMNELQSLLQRMGVPNRHPFWGSVKRVVMPADLDEIKEACSAVNRLTHTLADRLKANAQEIHAPVPSDRQSAIAFLAVLRKAIGSPSLKGFQLRSDLWEARRNELEKLSAEGRSYSQIRAKFDPLLLSEAWNQDLLQTRQALVAYQDKWWKFLSGEYRRAKSVVASLWKNQKNPSVSLLETVDAVLEARQLRESLNHYTFGVDLFPVHWQMADSDWNLLLETIPWILNLFAEIKNDEVPPWVTDFLTLDLDQTRLTEMASEIESLIEKLTVSISKLGQMLEFKDTLQFGDRTLLDQRYDAIIEITEVWAAQTSRLHEISSYNQLSDICREEQLQPYLSLAEEWEHAADRLTTCYRWNWYSSIMARAYSERSAIAHFDGSRHDYTVQKFKELDQAYHAVIRIKLAELHWSLLPKHEAGGQLGVLRREFEKKTRHLPIRQLMSKAGLAIQAIKPVFMMGPLSIAAYLEPGYLEFDLVIFDEASQVKPVDAFGAILRAKQAIVVGDSKQMPPTNFFDSLAKEADDDDEDQFVSDMESILGLFVGQNAPQRMLRWHYRSRHESLITVSNHEFYEDKLVVFPSPDSAKEHSGLVFHYLKGTSYDRGRSRTNKLEAKAVAEAVIEHALQRPHLSLGVAAFSKAQMQAVLDEVEVLRRSNPSAEAFFHAHSFEPFFVKNLENVQGDERDVMFISIGYGKTAEGYLAMEFGPLNNEGGERRLNVLITRARLRCEVFTNLRADDID